MRGAFHVIKTTCKYSLADTRARCDGLSRREVDQLLPVPEGVHLEKVRVAHLQSLAVLRQGEDWWRAVRHGEERDIRTCADPTAPWEGWKNASRLLDKSTLLYGRSKPPKEPVQPDRGASPSAAAAAQRRVGTTSPRGTSGTTADNKKWFIEPALSEESQDRSDWWLNYALGALAESSEAESAIKEAQAARLNKCVAVLFCSVSRPFHPLTNLFHTETLSKRCWRSRPTRSSTTTASRS